MKKNRTFINKTADEIKNSIWILNNRLDTGKGKICELGAWSAEK